MTIYNINQLVKQNGSAEKHGSDTNNCAVNTLAITHNVSYDDAYEFARKQWDRKHAKGVKTGSIVKSFQMTTPFGKLATRVPVTQEYKQPGGWMRKRRMTIDTFIKNNPQGVYYVLVRGHALAVTEGILEIGRAHV